MSLELKNTYYLDGEVKESYFVDENGNKQGPYEFRYKNGMLWYRYVYKDDIENGLYEEYYNNGQLLCKCEFKNGQKDGVYEGYYRNGLLWKKCYYKDDNLDGHYEQYDPYGHCVELGMYRNGKFISDKDSLAGQEGDAFFNHIQNQIQALRSRYCFMKSRQEWGNTSPAKEDT